MTEIKIRIPECYIRFTAGQRNRALLFRKYVQGYVRNQYPGYRLVQINGMIASCKKKG